MHEGPLKRDELRRKLDLTRTARDRAAFEADVRIAFPVNVGLRSQLVYLRRGGCVHDRRKTEAAGSNGLASSAGRGPPECDLLSERR